jgi:hypothetical protein
VSPRRRLMAALSAIVLVAAAAGGFLLGVALGERASQPGTQVLTVDRPASVAPRDVALRSAGGFTGFEAGALGGEVTREGVATGVTAEGLTLASGAAVMQVRYVDTTRFYHLVDADRPLAPGDVVVVRLGRDGVAEAVLRVPADLREGDSR